MRPAPAGRRGPAGAHRRALAARRKGEAWEPPRPKEPFKGGARPRDDAAPIWRRFFAEKICGWIGIRSAEMTKIVDLFPSVLLARPVVVDGRRVDRLIFSRPMGPRLPELRQRAAAGGPQLQLTVEIMTGLPEAAFSDLCAADLFAIYDVAVARALWAIPAAVAEGF